MARKETKPQEAPRQIPMYMAEGWEDAQTPVRVDLPLQQLAVDPADETPREEKDKAKAKAGLGANAQYTQDD